MEKEGKNISRGGKFEIEIQKYYQKGFGISNLA